jgi:hypothetical protein
MIRPSSLALAALILPAFAGSALADDGILITIGSNTDDSQRIRSEIEGRLAGTELRLLDPAATRASLRAFLNKSLDQASPAEIDRLMRQTGTEVVAVVRQLSREDRLVVFQVQVFSRGASEPVVRVQSVGEGREVMSKAVAGMVAELLPRQSITPSEEKEEGDDQKTYFRPGRQPSRLRT